MSIRAGHLPRVVMRLGALAMLAPLVPAIAVSSASAHSMDYALRGSGEVRIAFRYASGPPMINAAFRVFAPGGGDDPIATGVTDSAGEAGFRATSDGLWRIEASDATGQAIRARIDVRDGVPALGSRKIPDWLTTASFALNVLLVVGVVLARRSRPGRPRAAGRAETPPRNVTSPQT